MSRPPDEWTARVRRWLWLDRTRRTDRSEAHRGFYPGGVPVYANRKPVGRRFVLPVVALAIVIALVILVVRDGEASTPVADQRPVFDQPLHTITVRDP